MPHRVKTRIAQKARIDVKLREIRQTKSKSQFNINQLLLSEARDLRENLGSTSLILFLPIGGCTES